MNKKIIFIILLALLVIAGCEQAQTDKKVDIEKNLDKDSSAGPFPTEEVIKSGLSDDNNKGFTGTLKDALKLGASLKCPVQTADGTISVVIKGTNYLMEIKSQAMNIKTITKEEGNQLCVYTLSSNNQGRNECNKSCFGKVSGTQDESTSGKVTCVPAIVSDSEFDVPSDCKEVYQGAPQTDQGTPEPSPY